MGSDVLTAEDKIAFLKARVEFLEAGVADLIVDLRRLEGSDGMYYVIAQINDRIKWL